MTDYIKTIVRSILKEIDDALEEIQANTLEVDNESWLAMLGIFDEHIAKIYKAYGLDDEEPSSPSTKQMTLDDFEEVKK